VANSLRGQGKYVEAEAILREVIVVQQMVLGTEQPDTLMTAIDMAICVRSAGAVANSAE
jgi:hypothetical protein